MYNSASIIRQGVKANTDAKVLKAKLELDWAGPYNVLAVGPCSSADTPDGSPLGDNFYLDLPSDLPGSDARRCVAIEGCKPCANPTTEWFPGCGRRSVLVGRGSGCLVDPGGG